MKKYNKYVPFVYLLFCVHSFAESENIDETLVVSKSLDRLHTTINDKHSNLRETTNLSDLEINQPEIYFIDDGSRSTVTINGIGFTGGQFNPGIEPSISVYVDGIYMPRHSLLSGELINLKTVTFTQGHADHEDPFVSSLGTVSVSTQAPTLKEKSGRIRLKYGLFDRTYTGGGFNLDINDNSAMSGYLYKDENDGSIKNTDKDNYDKKKNSVGGRLEYLLNFEDTKIRLSHFQIKDRDNWTGTGRTHTYQYSQAQKQFFNTNVPSLYGLFGINYRGDGSIDLPQQIDFDSISSDAPNKSETSNSLTYLKVAIPAGNLDVASTTSYIRTRSKYFRDADNSDFTLGNQDVSDYYKNISQQFTLSYRSQDIFITGGLHYMDSSTDYETVNYLGADLVILQAFLATNNAQRGYMLSTLQPDDFGRNAPVPTRAVENYDRYTIYADIETSLTNNPLRAGISLSKVEKKFYRHQDGFCSYDTATEPLDSCTATSFFLYDKYYFDGKTKYQENLYSGFLWKGWELDNNYIFNASVGLQMKPGGYNFLQSVGEGFGYVESIDQLEFQKERSISVNSELSKTWDSNTTATVKLHSTVISDYQLSYYDGIGFYAVNANKVKSHGINFSIKHAITSATTLSSDTTYTKSYYAKHRNAPCPPVEIRSIGGCSFNGSSLVSDLSGEDLRSPRLRSSVRVLHDTQLLGNRLYQTLELSFSGKTRTTEYRGEKRGGFAVWNYHVNTLLTDNISLTLSARNILDKRVIVYEFPADLIRQITSVTGVTPQGGMNAYGNRARSVDIAFEYRF